MSAKSRFRKSVAGEPPVLSGSSDGYGSVLLAAALAVLIVAWATSWKRCAVLATGDQLLSQEEVIEALRFLTRERESTREARLASERLTPREREVLQALAEGSSDREIARRLHVGEGTVHSHVTNILSKLEVSSRLQALVFAVRHGVVTIE